MKLIVDFHEALVGKTIKSVEVASAAIKFHTADGGTYQMCHKQECCEEVYLEDVAGEWDDIVGFPLAIAEESSNSERTRSGSQTWTFYRLVTERGAVTLRWFGSSNGYYSESVNLYSVS